MFSVFPNVYAHLVKVGNNCFPCVQTEFGKYPILGESTQFWSLEYTNRKFGVGRSGSLMAILWFYYSRGVSWSSFDSIILGESHGHLLFYHPLLFFLTLLLFLSCPFSDTHLFLYYKGGFFVAHVEQLGDNGWWYQQHAAIWHWYLPLCVDKTFSNYHTVFVHSLFSV